MADPKAKRGERPTGNAVLSTWRSRLTALEPPH